MKQKVYCMDCRKNLTNVKNLNQCECGSRNFIFGNTLVKKGAGFACRCGSEKMRKVAHVNMSPVYVTTYACEGCGEAISTETYYKSPYMDGD